MNQEADYIEAGLLKMGYDLRNLREVEAPPSMLTNVMTRLSLADAYFVLDTPLGPVYVAYNENGVSAVEKAIDAASFRVSFRERFGRPAYPSDEPAKKLEQAVSDKLAGRRRTELRFDLRKLSEFERAVLLKALEIPRGEVRPYSWIAREIGRPQAVRAVGTALAGNPIPLLIPCHRVVRADGHIGNYGLGGPSAKRAMLMAEGVQAEELEALARIGGRFWGSETTNIYCFPTCRHARRINPNHRVAFRSGLEAAAAGYRPCLTCRPALAS